MKGTFILAILRASINFKSKREKVLNWSRFEFRLDLLDLIFDLRND